MRDAALFIAGLALGARAVLVEPFCETCLLVAVGLCVAPAALLPGRLGAEAPPQEQEPPA